MRYLSIIIVLVQWQIAAASKPNLFLLKTYQPDQNVTGWCMSEKLDGVRAYWDGSRLISRGGLILNPPDWFIAGFPPFELDGELWSQRNDFEHIVSIVRQQQPSANWADLNYHVFEVPHQTGGLLQRLSVLQHYLDGPRKHSSQKHGVNATLVTAPYLKVVAQTTIESRQALQVFFDQVIRAGGEGVVVRNPATLYKTGRLDDALKLKEFQDTECEVVGYRAGRGKYQGLTGSLKCRAQLPDQNPAMLWIGSGLSDHQRKNPPAIGSVVTFKYYGLTRRGLPRFPVFLRKRNVDLND